MTTLLAFVVAFAGFAALALSLDRHHEDVWHRTPGRRAVWALRVVGWLLLAAALVPCVRSDGLASGIVLWAGLLTMAALCVALLLTDHCSRKAAKAASDSKGPQAFHLSGRKAPHA